MSARPEQYRYGHSDLAGDRLRLLATLFEPTTRRFVEQYQPAQVRLALDLGCGPGYTTSLIADVTRARTLGLEFSPEFVERARRENATDLVSFAQLDVTEVPFPEAPADLIFARYLLAHVQHPHGVVERWLTQLAPGGRLLLEEVASISTDEPTLRRYLELTVSMLEAHGTDMYFGGELASGTWPASVIHNEGVELAPPTNQVATMFAMNLQTWRHDEWVTANATERELDDIAATLESLRSSEATGEITWHMRHLALAP